MSRYTFTGNEPHLNIVVGRDRPLQTFFAQVWNTRQPGHAGLLLWAGGGPQPVRYVEDLAESLAPFGTIPDEVVARLWDDFAEECEWIEPFKLLFRR